MYKTILKYLFIILAVVLPTTPAYAQMKKIVGETIYVGVALSNKDSLDEMVETCEYYHLTSQGVDESGYTVYQHPDGSIIRFNISTEGNKTFPVVEVTTKKKSKDIEKILTDLRFKKTDNGYETSGKQVRTHCQLDNKRLIFTRVYL